LEFLHDVTSPRSVIIVDDYGHFSTRAKIAVDEFVSAHTAPSRHYHVLIPDEVFGHFAVLRRTET